MTDISERAKRAKALLNDPMLNEAFEGVRQAILTNFENTKVQDHEAMLHLRLMLHVLKSVRANLTSYVNDGKVLDFNVRQPPQLQDFKR